MVNPMNISFDPLGKARYYPDHYSLMPRCEPNEAGIHKVNDNCYVHFNSSVPNRAFSLMTAGGVHRYSNINIPKGIGWVNARALWFFSFTNLYPAATFRAAALAQVQVANHWYEQGWGKDNFSAVACSWVAVGVLSPQEPSIARITDCTAPTSSSPDAGTTPTPKGPNCDGRVDGWACSENMPNTALKCKDGVVVDGAYCEGAKACKKAAADDWTATTSAEGVLTCE